MKINVLIFGSCVTRDCFEEFINNDTEFYLKDYYARSSFASLSGDPIFEQDISKIQSAFQRKMVNRDFSKDILDYDFSSVDLILFDFIDDRFALLELSSGACCTESDEFKKSELIFDAKNIKPFSDEFFHRWEVGWKKLLNKLKSANVLDIVLINKVFLAKLDDSGATFHGESYIDKMNLWLDRVYARLLIDIPERQFCDYKSVSFVSDSDHKWGRTPYHFAKYVNDYLINYITQFQMEYIKKRNSLLQTNEKKLTINPGLC